MLTERLAVEVIRNNMAVRQQNDLRLYLDVITDTSKISTDTVNRLSIDQFRDNEDEDLNSREKKGISGFLVGTNGKLLSIQYKK